MSILAICILLTACAVFLLLKVGKREDGLPPGPPTVPVLGNLHIFPTELAHHKFTEWARKYGGVYSLKVGPGTVIVLTDAAAMKELLDRRSSTTVDRPPLHVADVVTGGLHLALARYTENWKILRRSSQTILTQQAAKRHLSIQRAEATQLLYNFLHSPESFYNEIRRSMFSIIRSVMYGRRVPHFEAPEVVRFFAVLEEWNQLVEPGATPPLDMIPPLKLVPARWARWKRDGARVRALQRELYFGWLEETRERVRRGEGNGSYMEEVLGRREELGMDDEMAAYFGSALLETGSETTSSYMQSFVLALVGHPHVQNMAHEEIDRVIGDRMPTLEDLEDLPYVRAIILEVHRFYPVAPLSLPHATVAAGVYKGFVIPKGATIFANVWGIYRDPALFDDPDDFIPDRYLLTENGTKPGVDGSDLRHTLPFGFGRRACPGIHLAQNSINLNAMNLLWAFDFQPVDGSGIEARFKKGITLAPEPFACRITPRSAERAQVIEREYLAARDTFANFESPGGARV
ncbi:cytochrome P450 [Mycena filopes]|nr:cytochrome P450 [Mycena filopes]